MTRNSKSNWSFIFTIYIILIVVTGVNCDRKSRLDSTRSSIDIQDVYSLYLYSCQQNDVCHALYFGNSVGVNNIQSFRAMVKSVNLDNIPVPVDELSSWDPKVQSIESLPKSVIEKLAYELSAKFPQRNYCDYNKALKFNARTQTWFCQCRDNKLCSSSGSSTVDAFSIALYIGDFIGLLIFLVMLKKYFEEVWFLIPEFKKQGRTLEITHAVSAMH